MLTSKYFPKKMNCLLYHPKVSNLGTRRGEKINTTTNEEALYIKKKEKKRAKKPFQNSIISH